LDCSQVVETVSVIGLVAEENRDWLRITAKMKV
jgi:hypothetical protein